jgi:hypothetical protein
MLQRKMNGNSDTPFHAPDSGEMLQWIAHMYSLGPRRPGTKPDLVCENYLEMMLKESGFSNVRKDPIPIRVWEADNYNLSLTHPSGIVEEIPAFYIPYTEFTPTEGIRGRLVYVAGNEIAKIMSGSWKDKIVVADIAFPRLDPRLLEKIGFFKYDPDGNIGSTIHAASWIRLGWHMYHEAVRRGAAGFIGILKDHYRGGQNYYAPYGFKEKDIHDKPIPGFWVDRAAGDKIRRLALDGKASARLILTGRLEDGVTHNVIGEIRGESNEVFLIGCHHDSPFNSAVEDASGCAVILAAAKHFAVSRIKLRRTLMVCFTAGHFYGSIGSRAFIDRARQSGLLDKIALEFHVEHIAREVAADGSGRLVTLDRPEPAGIFSSFNRHIRNALMTAVTHENLSRVICFPPEGPFGPYPPTDGGDFHEAGVPVINIISSPVCLLNSEDTLDKVAADRLEPTTRTVIRILNDLDKVTMKNLRANHYPIRTGLMRAMSFVAGKLVRA